MFVITDTAQQAPMGGYYLSESELEHMVATGRWELGAHSDDGHGTIPLDAEHTQGNFFSHHAWLPEQARVETTAEFERRITEDMQTSQAKLEAFNPHRIISFAFPFGDIGQHRLDADTFSKKVLRIAGSMFSLLLYQNNTGEYFTQTYYGLDGLDGTYPIKRIDAGKLTSEELLTTLKNGAFKDIPYSDTFSEDKGWLSAWGDRTVNSTAEELTLRPVQGEAGASVLLDGSRYWDDYTVEARVESPARTGVALWVRFARDTYNAACNFGNGFVHVEETIDGVRSVIKGVRDESLIIPEGEFTITAEVAGRTVRCYLNGEKIVETEFLDRSLERGGIGFKTWAPQLNHTSLKIHEVTVSSAHSTTSASQIY